MTFSNQKMSFCTQWNVDVWKSKIRKFMRCTIPHFHYVRHSKCILTLKWPCCTLHIVRFISITYELPQIKWRNILTGILKCPCTGIKVMFWSWACCIFSTAHEHFNCRLIPLYINNRFVWDWSEVLKISGVCCMSELSPAPVTKQGALL